MLCFHVKGEKTQWVVEVKFNLFMFNTRKVVDRTRTLPSFYLIHLLSSAFLPQLAGSFRAKWDSVLCSHFSRRGVNADAVTYVPTAISNFFRYQSWLQDATPDGNLLYLLSQICKSLEDAFLWGVRISTGCLCWHTSVASQELRSHQVTLGSFYRKWKSSWYSREPVTK